MKILSSCVLLRMLVTVVSGAFAYSAFAAANGPAYDLAAQIRSQGYTCKRPISAKRDPKLSKPDEAVWLLACRGANYRIRLHPDMAASVELLSH
jgi:hypothetical protein